MQTTSSSLPGSISIQTRTRISMADVASSNGRRIVLAVAAPLVLLQLLVAARWPGIYAWPLGQTVLLLLATATATLILQSRSHRVAQVTWLIGYSATVLLAVTLLAQPYLILLLLVTPLMAAGSLSSAMALGASVVTVWAMTWLGLNPLQSVLDPSALSAMVITATLVAVVAWLTVESLRTTAYHSLANAEAMRIRTEEAREDRVELKQIQEDLLLANRELARLSERLKALHQVAEDARKVKEEFVANVSHELRTPLNMIIGFSEMITRSPDIYGDTLPAALLSDIRAIQQNSQHLASLINDVLDLSRVDAGRLALSKERVDLVAVARDAADAVRALYDSKKLYLRIDADTELPPIACDPTRVRQVIINLLSNAGRFTQSGGVDVALGRDGDSIIVLVRDSGPGISLERQSVLFEPFQQLDGAIYKRYGGSGLGLSISRKIVEMHNGKMWVISEIGKGTTVGFSLPGIVPAPPNELAGSPHWINPYQAYEPRTRRSKAPLPKVTPRYLLIEQGNALNRLINRYASELEVERVRSVSEAMQSLQRSPAQAVVVNGAPGTSTAPSATEMLDLPFGTPVFNCWIPEDEALFKGFRVVRHLTKPVTREALLTAITDVGPHIKTVLLVDDNTEFLQLFGRMLSSSLQPYQILRANSGRRALDLLHTRQPDLMLLDLVMPKMDGFQVLHQKNQDAAIRDIPVIVVSSQDAGGEPVVSNSLSVSRGGGISAPDLLASIQAISQILTPTGSAHRETTNV